VVGPSFVLRASLGVVIVQRDLCSVVAKPPGIQDGPVGNRCAGREQQGHVTARRIRQRLRQG
ncbi:MAG: hypothetical protein OET79_05915, partial [Nitrospirota bacterium]|nr:hypothetical protein [Nitrospirota bacterium]